MVDRFSPLAQLMLACALSLVAASELSAQQGDQQDGGQAGGGGGDGDSAFGLADPDDVFSGGIDRERDVPEASGAVGDQAPGGAGGFGGGQGGGGLGGLGGFGGLGGLGGFGGFGQLFGGLGQQQPQRSIRARLVSGVQINPPPPLLVRRKVNVVLDSIAANARFQDVVVRMDGRTAVLTGAVSSEADKRMARLVVRLEPGVGEVENQLVVRP